MGISVDTMLAGDYFKNFSVVSGHAGLGKHVQGVAVLDAPDGFGWTAGREFIISSGYVFKGNPDMVRIWVESGAFERCSCIGVKLGRYLDEMPASLVEACRRFDVPLLAIPVDVSWMGIMNAINVMVMNSNIKNFDIGKVTFNSLSDQSYHVRKIHKILGAVESVMSFPAMVYYLVDGTAFYSSDRFTELAAGMQPADFWEPPAGFSKELLCDNLKMSRYRIHDDRYDKPYSWITVPITVDNRVRAYFVVLEATGLLDYYDQYALRTGYVLLQELYEQILVTQNMGDRGFESFITSLLAGKLDSQDSLRIHADEIGLSQEARYLVTLIKSTNHGNPSGADISMVAVRDSVRAAILATYGAARCRVAIINPSTCLMLYILPAGNLPGNLPGNPPGNVHGGASGNSPRSDEGLAVRELLDKMHKLDVRLRADIGDLEPLYGVSDIPSVVTDLGKACERCLRALETGTLLFPGERFLTYSMLGPLAWFSVEHGEMDFMRRDLDGLARADSSGVLKATLRAYIENQMNFSTTARQVNAHINTVRRRIDDIRNLLQVNLEDPLVRLKLELLLRFDV